MNSEATDNDTQSEHAEKEEEKKGLSNKNETLDTKEKHEALKDSRMDQILLSGESSSESDSSRDEEFTKKSGINQIINFLSNPSISDLSLEEKKRIPIEKRHSS